MSYFLFLMHYIVIHLNMMNLKHTHVFDLCTYTNIWRHLHKGFIYRSISMWLHNPKVKYKCIALYSSMVGWL